MTQLLLNQSAPIHSLSGGSFANTQAGNSLMNIFAKGAGNSVHINQTDPFAMRPVSRFEVPDTAQVINLGDMVQFYMQTDTGEPFWTQSILPLVDYGWAVRIFKYGKWIFPQMSLRPSAETAPPRMLESYQMSAITQMEHFNIGQHMSKEYMKTEKGQLNQILNLKQMALSVQESMNLRIQMALLTSNRRTREFLEATGTYRPNDVKQAIMKEINRFCMIQKDEFGIECLTTQLSEEVNRNRGMANTWILTKKLNFLTLTKDHRTIYSIGGPDAVATVKDPNRSIMPSGTPIYYTMSYPERFGADTTPWQSNVQIGSYAWAGEIPNLNSGEYNEAYLRAYTTKCLSVWIYDQEKDSIVEMKADHMLYHSNLFERDGTLKALPENSEDPNHYIDAQEDFGMYDAKTIQKPEYHPNLGSINPASLENTRTLSSGNSSSSQQHLKRRSTPRGYGRQAVLTGKRPLSYIGHLDQKHFDWKEYTSAGYQIMFHLAKSMGMDPTELTAQYNAGMDLYKDLCQRKIDLKSLDSVFRETVKQNFLWQHGAKVDEIELRNEYVSTNGDDYKPASVNAAKSRFTQKYGDTSVAPSVRLVDVIAGFAALVANPVSEIKKSVENMDDDIAIRAYADDVKETTSTDNTEAQNQKAAIEKRLDDALKAWVPLYMLSKYLKKLKEQGGTTKGYKYNGTQTDEVIWNDIKGSCLSEEYNNGLYELKDLPGNTFLPLPRAQENFSLAGYASFDGLKELAKLYSHKDDAMSRLYNQDKLRTAHNFVNLIHKFSEVLFRLLPECELFTEDSIQRVHSRDKSKDSVVAERLLGMVGIPIWVNLKYAQEFIMSKSRAKDHKTKTPTTVTFAKNGIEVGPFKELILAVYRRYMGEPLGQLSSSLKYLTDEEAQKDKTTPNTKVINDLLTYVINPVSDVTSFEGYATGDEIRKDDDNSDTFFNLVGSNKGDQTKIAAVIFGSTAKYIYTRLVVEVANAILSNTGISMTTAKDLIEKLAADVIKSKKPKLSELIGALRAFIVEIYGGPKSKKSSSTLPKHAAGWVRQLDELSGKTKLEDILLKDEMGLSVDKTTKQNGLGDVYLKIANNLKVNIPIDGGGKSQSMIGGRVTREERRTTPKPHDDLSFFRTSLTFSPEQVEEIMSIKTTDADKWKGIFDIRVSDPSNFSHYLSDHHFKAMLQAIKTANEAYEVDSIKKFSNVRQLPDSLEDIGNVDLTHSPLVKRGWIIPLLKQDKRGERIFISNKATGNSAEERQHNANAFGILLANVTENMQNITYSVSQSCSRGLQRMAAIAYMVSPFKYNTLKSLLDNNLRFPISFVLFRPHMNYTTESGAYLAPGLETLGFTSVAGLDYDSGSNVMNKEWNAHLTLWFAPVVMHPENCYIQNNLALVNFGTGGGSKYYTPATYNSSKPGFRIFKDDYPSVMVVPLPKNEMITDEIISVTGRIPQYSSPAIRHDGKSYDTSYSTSARANHVWRWNKAEREGFVSTLGPDGIYPLNNVICCRGTAFYWNPHKGGSGSLGYWCPNRGHMGPEEGHGCKKLRQGELVKWPKFEHHLKFDLVA